MGPASTLRGGSASVTPTPIVAARPGRRGVIVQVIDDVRAVRDRQSGQRRGRLLDGIGYGTIGSWILLLHQFTDASSMKWS